MPLKSPTFSRRFPTLLSRRPHTIWFFWILGTCKTYCNHISIWTWHNTSLQPFVKIILDHGSQTYTPFFSKTIYWKDIFLDTLFFWRKSPTRNINDNNDTYPPESQRCWASQVITLDVPDVRQYNRQVISQFDGKKNFNSGNGNCKWIILNLLNIGFTKKLM